MDAEGRKRVHKNIDGGKAPKVYCRSGPVKDNRCDPHTTLRYAKIMRYRLISLFPVSLKNSISEITVDMISILANADAGPKPAPRMSSL